MCLERNGNEEIFFSKNFPAVVWFLEKKKGNFKIQVQFSIQFLLYFPSSLFSLSFPKFQTQGGLAAKAWDLVM